MPEKKLKGAWRKRKGAEDGGTSSEDDAKTSEGAKEIKKKTKGKGKNKRKKLDIMAAVYDSDAESDKEKDEASDEEDDNDKAELYDSDDDDNKDKKDDDKKDKKDDDKKDKKDDDKKDKQNMTRWLEQQRVWPRWIRLDAQHANPKRQRGILVWTVPIVLQRAGSVSDGLAS